MAAQGGKTAVGKKNVGWPAIVVSVIALIAFMAWWGYRSFGPEPDKQTAAGAAHDQWLDQIAKETGGDISKVKPDDLAKLQKQTYGHADLMLKAYAKDHGYAK